MLYLFHITQADGQDGGRKRYKHPDKNEKRTANQHMVTRFFISPGWDDGSAVGNRVGGKKKKGVRKRNWGVGGISLIRQKENNREVKPKKNRGVERGAGRARKKLKSEHMLFITSTGGEKGRSEARGEQRGSRPLNYSKKTTAVNGPGLRSVCAMGREV